MQLVCPVNENRTVCASYQNALLYCCFAFFALTSLSACFAQAERDQALAQFHEAGKLKDAGDFKGAQVKYEQLLKILPGIYGDASAPVVSASNELATLNVKFGKFAEADDLYQRSLTIQTEILGNEHPQVAKTLNALADSKVQQGKKLDAERLYRTSVAICRKNAAPDDPIFSVALNGLAGVCVDNGSYAEAEDLYMQSLDICIKKYGIESVETATIACNIGLMFFGEGKYLDSETWYSRSLNIRLKLLGENHPSVSETAMGIGALYYRLGRYDRAEFYLIKSLKIQESTFPMGSLGTMNVVNLLAQLLSSTDREEEARALYKKALTIGESLELGEHPFIAATLTNAALQKTKLGQIGEAETDFLRAHEIFKNIGNSRESVTLSLHNLAMAYHRASKFAEAEIAQRESLEAWRATFGDVHPYCIVGASNLGRIYQSMKRWPDALNAYDRSRHGAYRHMMEVVSGLPEQDQLNFLMVQDRVHLHRALSFALTRPDDDEFHRKTSEWIVNSKGMTEWSRAKSMGMARESQAPETAEALATLKDTQQQIARLTLLNAESKTGSPGAREIDSQIANLNSRKNQLVVDLQQLGSAAVAQRPWIEREQIQAALPMDSTLVDFVRLDFYSPDKEPIQSERYVAWVTSKDKTRLVDLGEAKEIDSSIATLRKSFDLAAEDIAEYGEKASEQRIRGELERLSQKLLAPILAEFKNSKRLVLCPDGDLWLVPWNALVLPDQKYLVEEHVLEFVVNSGELLESQADAKSAAKSTAPVIIADPDFSGAFKSDSAPARGLSADLKLGNISQLPGTAAEASIVKSAFKGRYKQEPSTYLRGEATATRLLSVQRPRALAIATHGFFLPQQSTTPLANTATITQSPTMASVEDPLLRCGLLFAGSNLPDQKGLAGVVTGRDILGLDLRGCEMVVLSACETGLGDVNSGNGIAGLRQAFHLAGAQAVVASLWNIPDEETTVQMKTFMNCLSAGQDLALALAESQREMLRTRRAKTNAAHPYNWAAFNVTTK